MDPSDPQAVAAALVERHREPATPDHDLTLDNYAERSRVGDWSMRGALCRFAQPQPARAAKVLTLVRRLDSALHSVVKPIQKHTVTCDRALSIDELDGSGAEPYPDSRCADLARLTQSDLADFDATLAAYEQATEALDEAEQEALPLLGVAVHLEVLADALAGWANAGPENPPIEQVDRSCGLVQSMLDDLGVPVEQGPPPRGRGGRSRGV